MVRKVAWVVVVMIAFGSAACGSGSSGESTVAVPPTIGPLTTVRPGFGGTLPVVSTTTSVAPTTTISIQEAALRVRFVEYIQADTEEALRQPSPNFARLRSYWMPGTPDELSIVALALDAQSSGTRYRLNDPPIDRTIVESIRFESPTFAIVTYCTENNLIAYKVGSDGLPNTVDDQVVDDSLIVQRIIDRWSVDDAWKVSSNVDSFDIKGGKRCAA